MQVREQIRAIIANVSGMDVQDFADDTDFGELGIDSLTKLDILTGLEKSFRVKLSEELVRDFHSIDKISQLLEREIERCAVLSAE